MQLSNKPDTLTDNTAPRPKLLALSYESALYFQACTRMPEQLVQGCQNRQVNEAGYKLIGKIHGCLMESWMAML